jgi:hypothetical protein
MTAVLLLALSLPAQPSTGAEAEARAAMELNFALQQASRKPAKPKAPAVSGCKCSAKEEPCRCPGTTCIECGCQCGKQRQWTSCNRPCCCGCQDEEYPEYCDCGEGGPAVAPTAKPTTTVTSSTTAFVPAVTYHQPAYHQPPPQQQYQTQRVQPAPQPYQPTAAWQAPAFAAGTANNERWRPRPQPIQQPRPVQQPRPSQSYCPPGGT